MRVLFLESHPLWIFGLPNGFCDSGHQVMISGPLTYQNIPEVITAFQPELIVMLGWGPEHTPEKQEWICQHVHEAKVPLVYWATEDPTFTNDFTLPLIKRVKPDFVFTICPARVGYYRRIGIKAAHMDFGYHPSIHCTVPSEDKYRTSIAVVANAYPEVFEKYPNHFRLFSLSTLIRPLLDENMRIDFYGRGWEKMESYLGIEIPAEWIHGYLSYTEANKVYSSADIVIGLQNYDTQLTQRTYEILGSGGFLLTQSTREVRRCFDSHHDLVASSTAKETVLLARYYLHHAEKRAQIRKQGMLAVREDTYQHRADYMLDVLQEEGILIKESSDNKKRGEIAYFQDRIREKYVVHDVQAGDTLWKIAKQYGVTVEHIMKENGLTSDRIYVDQYLKIKEI